MDQSAHSFDSQTLSGHGLACRRGGRLVFSGLDFSVAPGRLLFLHGKNGSGKSTLLRLIAGFLPASAGDLRYGTDVWDRGDAALSETLVYAGHDNGLKTALTLRENSEIYARIMTGRPIAADRLLDMADVFGLGALLDRPVRYFSSGQRHRASLMRFLLADRPVWLMDEPTVGLDADNRTALATLMQHHLDRGGIILAASHDPIGVAGDVLNVDECNSLAHAKDVAGGAFVAQYNNSLHPFWRED
ncbi:MAG: heme ABC exporter ATP-binding protein CcmA [Alphaproteobacteria bacterium]|nr:MAG: heme ABC exporter ATP-binding protein CcmA [Alphaproteobacteria bacterium]